MSNHQKGFSFSYSSEKQREIERIVSKYTDNSESRYQQLLKLDDGVETFATVGAIIYAIASVLTFGLGLSIILVYSKYIAGTVFCVAGIIMLFFTSKIRTFILTNRRKKVAPQIIELAKEISNSLN